MARVCDISGKRPVVGNHVSHSNNKVKRKFYPNLHKKNFYYEEEDRWLSLKVTSSVLKTINKNGLDSVIKEAREKGTLNTKAIKRKA